MKEASGGGIRTSGPRSLDIGQGRVLRGYDLRAPALNQLAPALVRALSHAAQGEL